MDLLTAASGLNPGRGTRRAWRTIRAHIAHLERDRVISQDIEAMSELLRRGELLAAVEDAVGLLH